METLIKLTSRNIRVFVRDRMSVFFSFLSVIITIGLYILFLGELQFNGIRSMVGGDIPGIRPLINSWIMAGLITINAVTVSLGMLGTMVFDIEYKRFPDFIVAPVSRTVVVASYLVASWAISLLFSLAAIVAAELYILSSGGALLSALNMLKAAGVVVLTVVSSSSVLFLIMSFIKTGSAFGTLSTVLGTLIGFLTGVYVPVGVLPDIIQKVVVIVPFSHSAALLRQIFCEQPMAKVFAGAPQEVVDSYIRENGVTMYWGDTAITVPVMLAVLGGVAIVFLLLSALRLRKYKQA
jgi:multidrug/hemolysin transport system permease protein